MIDTSRINHVRNWISSKEDEIMNISHQVSLSQETRSIQTPEFQSVIGKDKGLKEL